MYMYIYIYIHTIHTCVYIYIYIYTHICIERERERERYKVELTARRASARDRRDAVAQQEEEVVSYDRLYDIMLCHIIVYNIVLDHSM